jgi:hypothetical protein
MADPMERWLTYEDTPEFKKLSWDEQLKARQYFIGRYYSKTINSNPDLAENLRVSASDFIMRPPKLESPEAQQRLDQINSDWHRTKPVDPSNMQATQDYVTQRFQNDPAFFIKQLEKKDPVLVQRWKENGITLDQLDPNQLKQMQADMAKEVVDNYYKPKLNTDVQKQMAEDMVRVTAQSEHGSSVTQLADEVSKLYQAQVLGVPDELLKAMYPSVSDAQKYKNYLKVLGEKDYALKNDLPNAESLGSFIGYTPDIAAMAGGGNMVGAGTKLGTAALSAAMKSKVILSPWALSFLTKVIPLGTEITTSGVLGARRDIALEMMKGEYDPKTQTEQRQRDHFAKAFFNNATMDVIVATGMYTLPFLKNVSKAIGLGTANKSLSGEVLKEGIQYVTDAEKYVNGTLSENVFNKMPAKKQMFMKFAKEYQSDLINNPEKALVNPEFNTVKRVYDNTHQMILKDLDNNGNLTYKVARLSGKDLPIRTFTNLKDAELYAVETKMKEWGKLDPVKLSKSLKNFQEGLKLVEPGQKLDVVLNQVDEVTAKSIPGWKPNLSASQRNYVRPEELQTLNQMATNGDITLLRFNQDVNPKDFAPFSKSRKENFVNHINEQRSKNGLGPLSEAEQKDLLLKESSTRVNKRYMSLYSDADEVIIKPSSISDNTVKQIGNDEHMKGFVKSNSVYPSVKMANPETYLQALEKATEDLANAKQIGKAIPDSATSLAERDLMLQGYDTIRYSNGTFKPLYPSRIKVVGNVPLRQVKGAKMLTDLSESKAKLSLTPDKEINLANLKFSGDLTAILSNVAKAENRTFVKPLMSNILKNYGIDLKKITLRTHSGALPNALMMVKNGDELSITLPAKKLTNPDEIKTFIKSFTSQVKENILPYLKKDAQNVALKDLNAVDDMITANLYGFPEIRSSFSKFPSNVKLSVLDNLSVKVNGSRFEITPKGEFQITYPNIGTNVFKTADEAFDSLVKDTFSEIKAKEVLAQSGIKLENNNGLYVASSAKNILAEGYDLSKVLKDIDPNIVDTTKLDTTYAPSNIEVTKDSTIIHYDPEKNFITGNQQDLQKFFGNYKDYLRSNSANIKISNNLASAERLGINNYRVFMKNLQHEFSFETLEEAAMFIKRDWANIENIKKMAWDSGYHTVYDGKWNFIDGSNRKFVLNSLDEVAKFLRENPVTDGIPSVFTKHEDAMLNHAFNGATNPQRFLPKKPKDFYDLYKEDHASNIKHSTEQNVLSYIASVIKPKLSHLLLWANKTGRQEMSNILQKAYSRFKISEVAYLRTKNEMTKILSENVKIIPSTRRSGLTYFMETDPQESIKNRLGQTVNKQEWIKQRFELTPSDIKRAEDLHKLLGSTKYNGLFASFGVSPEKFLRDYVPRIRAWSAQTFGKENELTMESLFKYAEQGGQNTKFRKQLEQFFEHSRVEDVFHAVRNDDIYEILNVYNRVGNRHLYLKESLDEIQNYMRSNTLAKSIIQTEGGNTMGVLKDFLDVMTGNKRSAAEAWAGNAARGLTQMFKSAGLTIRDAVAGDLASKAAKRSIEGTHMDEKAVGDMLSNLASLNVTTFMGFRPYAAFKNATQIFTQLGTRYGHGFVLDAVRTLNDTKTLQSTLKELHTLGIVAEFPSDFFNLVSSETKLQKLTDWSLKAFGNVDQYTRAVSYMTVKKRFDYYLDAALKGQINAKKFFNYSGLNLLEDQNLARNLAETVLSNPTSRKSVLMDFAREVDRETMYDYSAINKPKVVSGFFGRFYGQYGQYTFNTINNIRLGLTRGTIAQRFGFAARYVATGMAIYESAKKWLNVSDTSYLPYMPVMFSGGPSVDIIYQAIESVGTMKKNIDAQKKFWAAFQNTYGLGLYQMKLIQQASDYWEKGRPIDALVRLSGMPVIADPEAYRHPVKRDIENLTRGGIKFEQ